MNRYGEASVLDLGDRVRRGRKVKVASRRLLPRPAASKMLEKMNAIVEDAC